MSFGTDGTFIETVKSRLRVSEVVGKRVSLKRRGTSIMGCCPFHQEKTPSFHVRDDKAYYHCFGCGAHGSVFDFLMNTDGLTFPQALEKAATMAGVSMPERDPKRAEAYKQKQERLSPVFDALNYAAICFQKELRANKQARSYIENRGVASQTQEAFGLGYGPMDNATFLTNAQTQNVSPSALISAGVCGQASHGAPPYMRFKDRLIFPIHNTKGRVVGFGGRALKAEQQPKYLNSGDAEHFHKGGLLYGLYHIQNGWVDAQKKITNNEDSNLLIVEGYMDVISLQQAGFSAVAPLGTALTEDQLALAWRKSTTPVLCFDGDTAGRRAAQRAASRALPLLKPGYSLRVVLLPQGEDPDSFMTGGQVAAFKQLLAQAMPLVDFYWATLLEEADLKTPELKARFKNHVLSSLEQIKDPDIRAIYQRDYKDRLFALFAPSKNPRTKSSGPKGAAAYDARYSRPLSSVPKDTLALLLMSTLFHHPDMAHDVEHEAINLPLPQPYKAFFFQLLDQLYFTQGLEKASLAAYLRNKGFDKLIEKLSNPEVFELAPFARPTADMAMALKGWRDLWKIYAQERGLDAEINCIAKQLKSDPSPETWQKLRALNELRRAQKMLQNDDYQECEDNLGVK